MFRVDPLTKYGTFDTDFFGSMGYGVYEKRVLWYLQAEGFDIMPAEFVIELFGHLWQCKALPYCT